MAKEEMLEFEGVVDEVLPDARCRVKLDNGHEVIAYTSGRMKKNRILAPLFKKQSRLNALLRDGELFPPLAVGRYNTLLPKKTPMIFKFGKPISTRKYKGATDPDTLWEVRERVEDAVTTLMQEAIDYLEERGARTP